MYNAKAKKFSKILVPIDGSELSMKATDYAVTLAREQQGGQNNIAELITLHVIPSESTTCSFGGCVNQGFIQGIIEDAKEDVETWFDKLQEKAKENKVKLRQKIIVNPSIVGSILDYAEREGIGLMVICSRGVSGFKKLLVGSVASGIVRYAHCPVLVVK
jgi:nucleotide-binding universal stress UspA family protein